MADSEPRQENTPLSGINDVRNTDDGWKSRTMGMFPEGTRIRKVNLDTHSTREYGEKTWTTGQTVRDIFQNHIDANTQVFFDKLVSSIVDTDDTSMERILTNPQYAKDFDEFGYLLYRYKKSLPDLSSDSKDEFGKKLAELAQNFPIKHHLLHEDGGLDIHQVDAVIEGIQEHPPQVTYLVRDVQGNGKTTWVTMSDLTSTQYAEKLHNSDYFRYEIIACKIEDEGKGFDSKLTAYFKSTKSGKRHLIGKFGEGTKMSEIHLVRNNADVKMRSIFQVDENHDQRERLWQIRSSLSQTGTIELRGVEVDTHHGTTESSGSYTVINIKHADENFAKEFRRNIDPRIPEGIDANSLLYATERYHYPMGVLKNYWDYPVGVCFDRKNNYQYVQGLKVGEVNSDFGEPLFSYDFLDSSILKGRDRSQLNESLENRIIGFWYNADSPELMRELITHVWIEHSDKHGTPEFKALKTIIDLDPKYLTPQQQRAQQIVFELIPTLTHLHAGEKHVFISKQQLKEPNNASLLLRLENNGYRIVAIECPVVSSNIDNLNSHYGGKYELFTLESARKKVIGLETVLEYEDERVLLAKNIYNNAQVKLGKLLEASGNSTDILSIVEPIYVETTDENNQQPVELEWLPNENKFRLVIRPEMIKLSDDEHFGKDYWERYVSVFLLASLNRMEPFPDQNSLFQSAQNNAQNLLHSSIKKGQKDFDGLPEYFDHIVSIENATQFLDRFFEQFLKTEMQMEGWQLLREARSLTLTPEQFQRACSRVTTVPPDYAQEINSILGQRVIIKNGKAYYDEYSGLGSARHATEKALLDLPVITKWQGYDVIRLDGRRFIVFASIPDGSVVTTDESHKYVYYQDSILDFAKFHFDLYKFHSYPITLEKNCIVLDVEPRDQKENLVAHIHAKLDAIKINSPQTNTEGELRQLSGTIDTPLPIEYGLLEWNNPTRVFQDIIQNHLDASPNKKDVTLQFEVRRNDQVTWVTEEELSESDVITGLTISDKGSGYSPNELGTMGNSSKRSPLFSGKYGEGQKMIAAAAARNGFQLSYSSVATKDGQSFRWTADVATRPETLVVDSKKVQTDRVVFHQTTIPLEQSKLFTSSTTLRLPQQASQAQQTAWRQWVHIIDPRVKDEKGNGGLARYVIDLRQGDNPNIIDLGYMRILLDEPGAIYENGLLISSGETVINKTVVGYDVPEVVNTRERNSYDLVRLQTYIAHAIQECQDRRLSYRLATKFKHKYLTNARVEGNMPYIPELDLNMGSTLMYDNGINPSRPFWDQANSQILGGHIVHSAQSITNRIEWKRNTISSNRNNPWSKDDERELEQLLFTLNNMSHIPKDRILHVSQSDYSGWAKIFPTAEDYLSTLNQDAVPTTPETLIALRNLVANSASIIQAKIEQLLDVKDDESLSFIAVCSEKKPDQLDEYDIKTIKKQISTTLQRWTNRQRLEEDPHTVFVAPQLAGYLGIVEQNKIGFNEILFTLDPTKIVGTSRHELIHKIFGIRDYTPEFVMLLLKLAE